MVIAYHLILSAYGFWLPNDERGSWSDFVRSYELYALGQATKVSTRRSVADRPFDRAKRDVMKQSLSHEPVKFSGLQAKTIAEGFAELAYPIHACAIMPDHVHLIVGRHHLTIEKTCDQLKARATRRLLKAGSHPFADQPYAGGRLPTPWARKGWWVFIDDEQHLCNAIAYVEQNPVKSGLKRQRWSFVKPVRGL